ncbi:MAG: hypothetical protein JJ979_13770 [Roseibium sp.]|nr:hypothetical protein [Roseibium sp.]
MVKRLKLLISFLFVASFAEAALGGEINEVITLKPYGDDDKRYNYPEELLKRALEKTSSSFPAAVVVRSEMSYSRDRMLQELLRGERLHVVAEAPKPEWEQNLLTIRIPIRKGIQGYRLFLINRQSQEALSKVSNLEDLKAFPTGSGAQWSTRIAMEKAGFDVRVADNYSDLFRMLKSDRFVTFGRGINEVFSEQAIFEKDNKDLIVEESLCLYIPLPTYFFVSPKREDLKIQLETGLNMMIEDGTFDELFTEYFADLLNKANLVDRRIFRISNPNLSKDTPLSDDRLWLLPGIQQVKGGVDQKASVVSE